MADNKSSAFGGRASYKIDDAQTASRSFNKISLINFCSQNGTAHILLADYRYFRDHQFAINCF